MVPLKEMVPTENINNLGNISIMYKGLRNTAHPQNHFVLGTYPQTLENGIYIILVQLSYGWKVQYILSMYVSHKIYIRTCGDNNNWSNWGSISFS